MPEPLNLETLVAQHFERLNYIVANAIKQLEELQAQLPPVGIKSEHPLCPHCKRPHPPWIFSCEKAREYVADERGIQEAIKGYERLAFMEGDKHFTEESDRIPPQVAQRIPPVEFLPVLHDDVLCIGTPGQLCTCPCAECVSDCVRQVKPDGNTP